MKTSEDNNPTTNTSIVSSNYAARIVSPSATSNSTTANSPIICPLPTLKPCIRNSDTAEVVGTLLDIGSRSKKRTEEEIENPKQKKKQRDYSFNPAHAMEYGLCEVVENEVVVAAECRFCVTFGREPSSSSKAHNNGSSSKKRRSKNIWSFKYPFRTTKYLQHLKGQHPAKWDHYQKLSSPERKQHFFRTAAVHHDAALARRDMKQETNRAENSLPASTRPVVVAATTTVPPRGKNDRIEAEKEVLAAQTYYSMEKKDIDFDHPSFQRFAHAIAKASKLGAKYLYSSDAVEGFSLGRQL